MRNLIRCEKLNKKKDAKKAHKFFEKILECQFHTYAHLENHYPPTLSNQITLILRMFLAVKRACHLQLSTLKFCTRAHIELRYTLHNYSGFVNFILHMIQTILSQSTYYSPIYHQYISMCILFFLLHSKGLVNLD